MKNTLHSAAFLVLVILLTACQSKKTDTGTGVATTTDTIAQPKEAAPLARQDTVPVNELVTGYLQLKNALANDNGSEAAKAAQQMHQLLNGQDASKVPEARQKDYADILDALKEHSEHIGSNGNKIAHQREHFDYLSEEMLNLLHLFPASQTLYRDHCPMYKNGKGADWLSESKAIKNPYLGKEMPTCGTVKETIGAPKP